MIKKTKSQLRKEVAELIDNIKEHSDEIGEKKRIPQLELEVICAKIKKLYEISIVYNYLNTLPEEDQEEKSSVSFNTQSEKQYNNASELIEKEIIEIHEIIEEPVVQKIEEEIKDVKEEVAPIAEAPPAVQENATARPIRDIKTFIGINDKFRFINELFKGNSKDYDEMISILNSINTDQETNVYVSEMIDKQAWDMESEMFVMLINIIEKRFS